MNTRRAALECWVDRSADCVRETALDSSIEQQTLSEIRHEVMAVRAAVLAQFDRVLNQELKVRQLHIRLFYRVRQ